MSRSDGRAADELRPVTFERGWLEQAEGSALVSFGRTRVLCTASFSAGVPRWLKDSGKGWVTAEYAMLPRSTNTRNQRESVKGKLGGRTQEISRLVGRSLRAVVDMQALGENSILIDCDVLQADGGTRTAAITGAYVALADAVAWAKGEGLLKAGVEPLKDSVAAVSVGIVDGEPRLDLHYDDDVNADTDMNVVMTGDGRFVEVQGTAEGEAFDRLLLDRLLNLAGQGCARLTGPAGPGARAAADREGLTLAVQVVLATKNRKKLDELHRILEVEGLDVELLGIDAFPDLPDIAETESSFEGNALLKAREIARITGLPAVADDSGLCVDALNGMPGIFSARWAGRHGDDEANLDLRARAVERRAGSATIRLLLLRGCRGTA